MDRVATMTPSERAALFDETAARNDLLTQIVEKDFWVCWVLKQIFSHDDLNKHLLFKGGTSLSKVFGLIRRFSEDIDLAVDWEMLGFTSERDPMREMSRSKREKLLKQMMASCRTYISGDLKSTLLECFSSKLGTKEKWSLDLEGEDSLVFSYPTVGKPTLSYVRQAVVMELGTHAEFLPNGRYSIQPYAADTFPDWFEQPNCTVTAIMAERTFWEKATILHAEYHRPREKITPVRYSRHYYDIAIIGESGVAGTAIDDCELLQKVVHHKQRFYTSAWARYDLAQRGTFRLIPPEHRIADLRQDYSQMQVMIFDEALAFDVILERLEALEARINQS